MHFNLIKGKIGTLASEFYIFLKNYSDVVKIEDIERVAFMAWEKTKDINATAKFIEELVEKTEEIQKIEMANVLIEKYLHEDIKDTEQAMPLIAFLYAMPLEILGTVLRSLGTSKESGDAERYKKLVEIDFNKTLFRKAIGN